MERNVNYGHLPIVTLGRRNRRWHMHGEDPDLNAYLAAIYNATPINISSTGALSWRIDSKARWALNELIKSLKGEGLWSLMVGIYPLITGRYGFSSSNWANSYNLKDATLTMSFSSGTTFQQDEYGVKNTGSSEVATLLSNCRSGLSNQDFNWHVSVYSNRRKGQSVAFMHAIDGASGTGVIRILMGEGANNITASGNALSYSITSDTNGCFVSTRTSTTSASLYRNGLLIANDATLVSTVLPTSQLLAFGSLTASRQFSQYISFITVGFGLTDNQAATLSGIVERFNTRLGRSTT